MTPVNNPPYIILPPDLCSIYANLIGTRLSPPTKQQTLAAHWREVIRTGTPRARYWAKKNLRKMKAKNR